METQLKPELELNTFIAGPSWFENPEILNMKLKAIIYIFEGVNKLHCVTCYLLCSCEAIYCNLVQYHKMILNGDC